MTIRFKTKPTLTKILSDLLEQAKANPGEAKVFNLKHGLAIAMRIHADNTAKLSLGISRFKVWPSDQEWGIVCRALGLPQKEYKKTTHKFRNYLVAMFELPAEQESLPI